MELLIACPLLLVQTCADCSDYVESLVYPQLDTVMNPKGRLYDFMGFRTDSTVWLRIDDIIGDYQKI